MDSLLGRLSGVAVTDSITPCVYGEHVGGGSTALEVARASSSFIASLPAVVVQAIRTRCDSVAAASTVAAFALWRNSFPRRDICVCPSSDVEIYDRIYFTVFVSCEPAFASGPCAKHFLSFSTNVV